MSADAATVAQALEGAKRAAKGWVARCPAHDDRNPSLSLHDGEHGLVWHCHAGCDQASVRSKLIERGLYAPGAGKGSDPDFVETVYTYRDKDGKHWADVVRRDYADATPKWIRPRMSDGSWRLPAGTRPLYRLPELLARDASPPVLVVEGEKVADAAAEMPELQSFAVTTSVSGSKAAGRSDWSSLRSMEVLIWPDHDSAGLRYARDVAKALKGQADVRYVLVPESFPKGWDLADPLPPGHTIESLLAGAVYVLPGPEAEPETEPEAEPAVKLASANGREPEPEDEEQVDPAEAAADLLRDWASLMAEPPVEWLVDDLLPVGGLSLIVAAPKVGKSTLLRELLASHGSGGGPFLGRNNRHGGSFLYIALDEHPSMIRDHFAKLTGTYPADALSGAASFVTQPVDPLLLPELITESGANLVAIDTLGQYASGIESGGEYFEWTAVMAALRAAATETGAHIVMLHHARKGGGQRGLSTLGSQAIAGAVDTIIEIEAIYNKVTGTYTRSISSTNRAGKDIPRTVLELDPDHGTLYLDTSKGPKAILKLEARSMRRDGLSPKQISEKMDCHLATVYRWLKDDEITT